MVTNRKPTGKAMSLPGGAVLGALMALIWTFIASGILAWLIKKEMLPEAAVGYGSMVILLTASMLGSMLAYQKVKRQRAIICAGAGGIYFLMLLAMTALFFGGQYSGIGVTALLILSGVGVVILLGMGQGKGKPRGVRKFRA